MATSSTGRTPCRQRRQPWRQLRQLRRSVGSQRARFVAWLGSATVVEGATEGIQRATFVGCLGAVSVVGCLGSASVGSQRASGEDVWQHWGTWQQLYDSQEARKTDYDDDQKWT